MTRRRTLVALLSFAAIVGAVVTWRSRMSREPAPSGTTRPEALRLAINPVPQGAPVILAIENGHFASEGLRVDVSRFTTGKLAFDAVLGGAAAVADVPMMYATMSGQPPAILATIERSGQSVKLLGQTGSGGEPRRAGARAQRLGA